MGRDPVGSVVETVVVGPLGGRGKGPGTNKPEEEVSAVKGGASEGTATDKVGNRIPGKIEATGAASGIVI